MPLPTLALPFVISEKEKIVLNSDMETAAILLLTEQRRRKRTILEAGIRKVSLVSKLHYPLWAIPWEGRSLLLDGLDAANANVTILQLPDIGLFIEDIERGAQFRKEFHETLGKYETTFRNLNMTQIEVNSLIADPELQQTLFDYLKDSDSQALHRENAIFMAAPKLDLHLAVERARKVDGIQKRIRSEARSLEYAKSLLEETAKNHGRMIQKEIESTLEAYRKEISALRPETEKKVDQLRAECETRMARMSKLADRKIKPQEQERERREHQLQKLEVQRVSLLTRIQTRKRRHDKIAMTHLEHLMKAHEKNIDETKSKIQSLSELIERTRGQNQADIERLRQGYEALIDQEKRKIADLEDQRNRREEAKEFERERIARATAQLSAEIAELANRKRDEEKKLTELAIPWPFNNVTLLCLPFYLVYFQIEKKTSFHVFPPLKLMGQEGILKSLQKTIASLGAASTLEFLLRPRSKALRRMLEVVLKEKMKSDQLFRDNLLKAASSANILDLHNLREMLINGVNQLRAVGWLSQREAEVLAAFGYRGF